MNWASENGPLEMSTAQEFLPLCDILFNIISLASYFCDVVFDVVTVYTLYVHYSAVWFAVALFFVLLSIVISQIVSLKWYLQKNDGFKVWPVVGVHFAMCGVLWRYFKLFMPVDLMSVKNEVRDLCLLRLVHAFCQAAPMLLLQLYLIWLKPDVSHISDLNIVSTFLSLFSVCWALASFNKNVRQKNIHRLILTWLGVIFQFLWRMGTVSSRVTALTVYATLYQHWFFAVVFLHWVSMLLWLVSPKNIFHNENISCAKKGLYSMLISYIFIFGYINLHEVNAVQKTVAYYITMFFENSLLMAIWYALQPIPTWYQNVAAVIVWGGYSLGILFMVLYYQCFHVKHLKQSMIEAGTLQANCKDYPSQSYHHREARESQKPCLETLERTEFPNSSAMTHLVSNANGMVTNIPGVFNCRLNPALKRKKKMPSTFIPPPPSVVANGKAMNAFWKRALSQKSGGSDHESSVGSTINIQKKLQEKKMKQLQDLHEIEEEIMQGKLKRPMPIETSEQKTVREPIPPAKKQPFLEEAMSKPPFKYNFGIVNSTFSSFLPKSKPRSQTPEVLLSPHYLENSRIYYDYAESRHLYSYLHTYKTEDNSDNSSDVNILPSSKLKHSVKNNVNCLDLVPCHPASDVESQVSLPRSYTLPREFKYFRRPKVRKISRDVFPSNNSSDGDVDSADETLNQYMACRTNKLSHSQLTRKLHQKYETPL